jgi:hypothetical protein
LAPLLRPTTQFGTSVSLNAAGDRLAVGAWLDDGFGNAFSNSGSVRLFTFANTSFGGAALAATIGRGYSGGNNLDLGTDLEASDQFGQSVSLNAAGDRLAVGAIGDDGFGNGFSNSGSVRLFSFTNTSFGGGALAATIGRGYSGGNNLDLGTALEAFDQFGASVSLNAAGDRLAVGANFDDGFGNSFGNSGSVRLFTFTNTSFGGGALAATIGRGYTGGGNLDLGTDLGANDNFGHLRLAERYRGPAGGRGSPWTTALAMSFSDSGSVRLFSFTNTSFGGGALAATIGRGYTGGGNLDLGTDLGANDNFGHLRLAERSRGPAGGRGNRSDDGFGNAFSNFGSVQLFTFANTSFSGGAFAATLGAGYVGTADLDLRGLGLAGGFGSAVAFDAAGERLALGSSSFAGNTGAVHLFTYSPVPVGNLAFATNPTGTSNVSVSGLAAALASGTNIALEASNDITLASALTVGGSTGGTLALTAGRSILLDAPITTANGGLNLTANSGGSDLTTVNANRQSGAAVITMGPGATINAGTGAVNIALTAGTGLTTATSGSVTLNTITAQTIAVSNAGTTTGSNIVLNPGTVLTASGTGRAIDLQARTGTFTNNAGTGAFSLTGGGTYGVFSDNPDNTLEGVTGFTRRYNIADASAFGGFAPAGANVIAYRIAPFLTVTADALSRIYGDANPALTYGLTGFLTGDTAANSTTGAASLSTTATASTSVGSAPITVSLGTLASDLGYQFTLVGADLTITARPITLTADALSRIYGNANPALTYTVGGAGLVNGDTLTGALATTATLTTGVGTAAITQGSLAASANYAVSYVGADLTITARPITLTADALSRIYGNANPALTYTVGGAGLVNGDSLTGALATTATLTTGVGTAAITQGSLAASANYAVSYVGADLTITARPITLTADALSRIYGNANPALTYTVGGSGGGSGLVNGDTLTGALATTATLTTGVGTAAITQGSLAASPNYAVSYVGADLTITARPITLTADALSRIYGNANPALTYTVAGSGGGAGLVNGDSLTGALATTATLTTGVGTAAITQGSLAASANYAVSYVGADLTITARPITLTADALSRIYGNANPALTYTVGGSGLVNGDSLTGALATTATLTTGVGTAAITQGSLAASPNYAVSYVGADLTITARPITLTADALSRIYGDANPALTYTVGGAGLVNGDTLTGALATTATLTTGVGTAAITQGSLAASANYAVSYVGADLTITARPITLTADALSRIYGNANPALTYTVGGAGLVNGDTLTGALATTATLTTGVGTAAITQGSLAASANYAVSYVGADLTITARPITLTADALSRIYGNANPALTYTVGGSGLVNGDSLTGALATTATLTTGVGTAAITQGSLAASPNYAVSYVGADLTITARPITLTADALSRIYGNANPALTYTVGGSGLVNGDSLTGALATTATLTTGVGTAAITQGSLAASANYAVSYVGADLTITARPITLTADALSRIYGNANPALTYTVGGSGLVNGDTLTGALATTATLTTGVGSAAITQGSLAASANYAVSYVGADLTITARPITLTADALSRIYGDANPALTYTVGGSGGGSGLVNGDTLTGALATTATLTTGVGTAAITQGSLAASANYAVSYVGADLTITARPITLTADDVSRLVGQVDPALTYTVTTGALQFTDTLSGSLTRIAGETPGAYPILIGSLGNPNYQISYVGANFTITGLAPDSIPASQLSATAPVPEPGDALPGTTPFLSVTTAADSLTEVGDSTDQVAVGMLAKCALLTECRSANPIGPRL